MTNREMFFFLCFRCTRYLIAVSRRRLNRWAFSSAWNISCRWRDHVPYSKGWDRTSLALLLRERFTFVPTAKPKKLWVRVGKEKRFFNLSFAFFWPFFPLESFPPILPFPISQARPALVSRHRLQRIRFGSSRRAFSLITIPTAKWLSANASSEFTTKMDCEDSTKASQRVISAFLRRWFILWSTRRWKRNWWEFSQFPEHFRD